MDTLQQGIITLIRSSITGEKLSLPKDFELEASWDQIMRHGIATMAYEGAVNCGVDKTLPVMTRLFQAYVRALVRSERQMAAVGKIRAEFEKAGIDHLLLKGCVLKELYPKAELRGMGDADILVRVDQHERIRPILEGLGFAEQQESDHELIWQSRELLLELHKRLIPSYNKDYYRYFGDGWRLAKPVGNGRWEMSREDEYIYLFTHFAKHYRDGGIGCRHMADLWVFRRAYELDEAYIAAELKKLHLKDFGRNIQRTLLSWFEEGEWDEMGLFITDFIFKSGSWGDAEAHSLSTGAREAELSGSARRGFFARGLKLVFPSARALSQRYPILKSHRAMLPLVWIYRFGDVLLRRRDKIKKQGELFAMATPGKVESYQQALSYVGLDFNFKD